MLDSISIIYDLCMIWLMWNGAYRSVAYLICKGKIFIHKSNLYRHLYIFLLCNFTSVKLIENLNIYSWFLIFLLDNL